MTRPDSTPARQPPGRGIAKPLRRAIHALPILLLGLAPTPLPAAVDQVTVTDVTTRAFALVWFADRPVHDASVRVYTSPDGSAGSEITGELDQRLVSPPAALAKGLVKVEVTRLAPEGQVYVRTYTEHDGGAEEFPLSGPLPEVVTRAIDSKRSLPADRPIVNDLLRHAPSRIAAIGPVLDSGAGTLLLVSLDPDQSPYPLSAFVGQGVEPPAALVDLNNHYDPVSGRSAVAAPGTKLRLREFRGLPCAAADQALDRYRRVPAQGETPANANPQPPAACFAPDGVTADLDCDGAVDDADLARFVAGFTAIAGDCRFNPDLDLQADGVVDPRDFNRFLGAYGASE